MEGSRSKDWGGGATQVIGELDDVILRRKELSRSTKLKVVNTMMMPTLLYGCEMWTQMR